MPGSSPGMTEKMNWISNVVRPKIRSFLNRRESPENLWIKCPETGQLVFYKDVEANQFVIPSSNYHMRVSAPMRLKTMFDGGEFEDIAVPEVQLDPLKFRDERRYVDRLKDARAKTGLHDAIKLGLGKLDLLIWFGALTAVTMQTAYLSPPVAMSAYYLRNVVPQWSLGLIYKGMADYMVIQVIVLILLLSYPQIALWLPNLVR